MHAMRIAALLILVPATAEAQERSARDPLSGFDAYVRQALKDWEVPGLAIAVVKHDSVVFARAYGVKELATRDPVTTHTLFANASTTKAFTSMAVAMMVDEGKLGWGDPVAKHLPTFVMPDPYVTREVTIRDLLTHRLGFGDPSYLWYGVNYEYPEIVRRLRHVEPATSFRSHFAYNNISYATAGIIAGEVNGTSWDELVQQRILQPLGMRETVTQGRDLAGHQDVARPHDLIDDTLRVISGVELVDPIAPAGSMYSSVSDMTHWMRFLLNEGRVGDQQLVSDTAFAELLRPQVIISEDEFYPTAHLTHPHFTAYGLGWFLQDYRGEFVAFHTGSIDGTVAIMGLMPDRELGLVVFANRDHAELRHALMYRVFDAYLGGERRDWSTDMQAMYDSLAAEGRKRLERLEEQRVKGTAPTLPLEEYAGTYNDSLYGTAQVRLEENALVLERSPHLTADLSHWHYDVFRTVWRKRWLGKGMVSFRLGRDGKVAALEIQGMVLQRIPKGEGAEEKR